MSNFILDIFGEQSEIEMMQRDSFLATQNEIELKDISPVSFSETVDTAFQIERNKLNHFRP